LGCGLPPPGDCDQRLDHVRVEVRAGAAFELLERLAYFSGKMRFFTANAGAAGARLKVQVLYNGGAGSLLGSVGKLLRLSEVGYVSAGKPWQPSPPIGMLGGTLPLLTSSVQFRFTAPADGGRAGRGRRRERKTPT
jgi:hypothetical protein